VQGRTYGPLVLLPLLAGCHSGVLEPVGPVGAGERLMLLDSLAIMLAIVVPVIVATLVFAWWFRASNTRARHLPDWAYSGRLELMVWSVPAMVVLFLGGIGWAGAHIYDPPAALQSKTAPLDVQVVSLDWKWLFIYPTQGVASVGVLEVPAGTPIRFQLTSATVMNAFFAPRLGSMIYTMAGMVTRLNLQADKPGDYPGIAAQINGDGFSDMRFTVHAAPPAQFQAWVAAVKAKGGPLDGPAYAALAKPGPAPVETFGSVAPDLFGQIVAASAPGSNGAPVSSPLAAPGRPRADRG
jgi:cytochrome o ubiquinol oxidase subunit 2